MIVINHVREFLPGFYIGRGSPLGNPFQIGKHGTREEVIVKFEEWFENALTVHAPSAQSIAFQQLREELAEFGLVRLNCFCHPQACHGHVIGERLLK